MKDNDALKAWHAVVAFGGREAVRVLWDPRQGFDVLVQHVQHALPKYPNKLELRVVTAMCLVGRGLPGPPPADLRESLLQKVLTAPVRLRSARVIDAAVAMGCGAWRTRIPGAGWRDQWESAPWALQNIVREAVRRADCWLRSTVIGYVQHIQCTSICPIDPWNVMTSLIRGDCACGAVYCDTRHHLPGWDLKHDLASFVATAVNGCMPKGGKTLAAKAFAEGLCYQHLKTDLGIALGDVEFKKHGPFCAGGFTAYEAERCPARPEVCGEVFSPKERNKYVKPLLILTKASQCYERRLRYRCQNRGAHYLVVLLQHHSTDISGLYTGAAGRAAVFSLDEKGDPARAHGEGAHALCQAPCRSRRGPIDLFPFLAHAVKHTGASREIHIVLNCAKKNARAFRQLLDNNQNVSLHFIPDANSWLHLVKGWLLKIAHDECAGELTMPDLIRRIVDLRGRKGHFKPFRWMRTGTATARGNGTNPSALYLPGIERQFEARWDNYYDLPFSESPTDEEHNSQVLRRWRKEVRDPATNPELRTVLHEALDKHREGAICPLCGSPPPQRPKAVWVRTLFEEVKE